MNTKWLPHTLDDMPRCQWRISARAKYLRLVFRPYQGLELISPQGTSERTALRFLKQEQDWVRRQWRQCKATLPSQADAFPTQLDLRAIHQQWSIHYQTREAAPLKLSQVAQELFLTGNVSEFHRCLPLMKRWLKRQAEQSISPLLRHLSQQYQLPFNQVSFRFQRTRWGSCSQDKNINLNVNLLFIPPELMQHVLLHELCHTQVMNHSAAFWRLLETLDPQARQHDRALRQADQYLPIWIFTQSIPNDNKEYNKCI